MQVAVGVVDVDAEQSPQEVFEVLAGELGVVTASAVTESDVEVAIRTEGNRAAVVVGERLRDCHQDAFGIGVGTIGVVAGESKLREDLDMSFSGAGVAEVELSIGLVLRVEAETEQAFFVSGFPVADSVSDVEEQSG